MNTPDPLARQVGGDHYRSHVIQPIEYMMGAHLTPAQAFALKHMTRPTKGQVGADIDKCLHYLEFDARGVWPAIEPSQFIDGLAQDVPAWMRRVAYHIAYIPLGNADMHRGCAQLILRHERDRLGRSPA